MSDNEQAIRALISTWCQATEAGDMDALAPLMAEDMVFLTPGREPFGKQEFLGSSDPSAEAPKISVDAEVREIQVSGDLGYAWLKLTVSMTPPGGAPARFSGHTIGIYRRENGRWMLARDANLVA